MYVLLVDGRMWPIESGLVCGLLNGALIVYVLVRMGNLIKCRKVWLMEGDEYRKRLEGIWVY
jgi:hypothetical protein